MASRIESNAGGNSLLTTSIGKTGRNSLDHFLRVTLKKVWTRAASLAFLVFVPALATERERPLCVLHSVGPGQTAQELLWVAPGHCWHLQTGRVLITMGLNHSPAFIMSTMNRNETEAGVGSGQWAGRSRILVREAVQEVNSSSRANRIAEGREEGPRDGAARSGRKDSEKGRRCEQRGKASMG